MCQYHSECPTTRHREGTQCPVIVSIEKHNRKVDEQNRQNVISLIVIGGIAIIGFAVYWFMFR